jgi:lipoprotein-releasing system permease protein
MAMPLALTIALRHLLYRRRQTMVSILGVAMGVGFFIALAAMMQGFQQYIVNTIVDVAPHIVVHQEYRNPRLQPAEIVYGTDAAIDIRSLKPRDERRGIRGYQSILAAVEKLPDVDVSSALSGPIFLRYGNAERSASLLGIIPRQERHISKLEKDLTAGQLEDLETAPNGIIIGAGLAKNLGAGMGDRLIAVSPQGVLLQVKIVGLLDTGIVAIDDAQAYMLLKKAQILQDKPNRVNQIRLRLTNPDDAQVLAAKLEERFLYRFESWQESNAGIFGVFIIQNIVMYSTVTAIMIVAAFGIFNIISTIIHEKVRDIAILRSLGFYEADIRNVFVLQGTIVGLLGAVLGWGVGYGLSSALAAVRLNIEGEIRTDRLFILFSLWPYLIGAGISIAAAVLAAWLPSRKAAAVKPVDIIRGVS